jgi:hypothetical protein
MTRPSWKAIGVVGGVMVAVPALAIANVDELGQTKTPLVAPSCPPTVPSSSCTIILTRVTALETVRDGIAYPTKVKASGRIVAFSVGLSELSPKATTRQSYIHYLDQAYGGTAQVAITVLRQVGKKADFRWETVAASPLYHVEAYLGHVIQVPLDGSIEVKPGYVVALTTPTWAPVLSINVDSKMFVYRQSRSKNCNNPPGSNQAQLNPGVTASYVCNYPGTRLEYSVSEITYPFGTNPQHTGTVTTTTTTTHTTSRTTSHTTSRTTSRTTSHTTSRTTSRTSSRTTTSTRRT